MSGYGIDAGETSILKALKTPERVQRYLDTVVAFNKGLHGETILSPRRVVRNDDQVAA